MPKGLDKYIILMRDGFLYKSLINNVFIKSHVDVEKNTKVKNPFP